VLAQINQIDPMYVYFNIADVDLARLLKSKTRDPGPAEAQKWPVFAGSCPVKKVIPIGDTLTLPPSV